MSTLPTNMRRGRPKSDNRENRTFSLGVTTISKLERLTSSSGRTPEAVIEKALRNLETGIQSSDNHEPFLRELVPFLNAGKGKKAEVEELLETMINPFLWVQGYRYLLEEDPQLTTLMGEYSSLIENSKTGVGTLREIRTRIEQMIKIALPADVHTVIPNGKPAGISMDNALPDRGFVVWISEVHTFKVAHSFWKGPRNTKFIRNYVNPLNPETRTKKKSDILNTIFFDFKFGLIEKIGLIFSSPSGELSKWATRLRRCVACKKWFYSNHPKAASCSGACRTALSRKTNDEADYDFV